MTSQHALTGVETPRRILKPSAHAAVPCRRIQEPRILGSQEPIQDREAAGAELADVLAALERGDTATPRPRHVRDMSCRRRVLERDAVRVGLGREALLHVVRRPRLAAGAARGCGHAAGAPAGAAGRRAGRRGGAAVRRVVGALPRGGERRGGGGGGLHDCVPPCGPRPLTPPRCEEASGTSSTTTWRRARSRREERSSPPPRLLRRLPLHTHRKSGRSRCSTRSSPPSSTSLTPGTRPWCDISPYLPHLPTSPHISDGGAPESLVLDQAAGGTGRYGEMWGDVGR